MKHDGQEIIVTGTFEEVRLEGELGGEPYAMPRPTRCVIAHLSPDGTKQELTIDGKALAQLRILLDRMYSLHDGGVISAQAGTVIPRGGPRRW